MRRLAVPVLFALSLPAPAEEPKAKSSEELAEQVRPSLCVGTTRGRGAKREGLGTGVVVGGGLIANTADAIGQCRPIAVEFPDCTRLDVVAVHAHDHKRYLAILRVRPKDLPVLALGDSDKLKTGQAIVAFGNPKGLTYSVVSGVVSGVRDIDGRKMIQLALPVEPGNSGGPVVASHGRVQGIVT